MRFLQNNKGFTRAKFTVTVIIAAILIFVAFPFYNLFYATAQSKDCIAAQQELISRFTELAAKAPFKGESFTFTVTTDGTGKTGVCALTASSEKAAFDADDISAAFDAVPHCPKSGDILTVAVATDPKGVVTVTTSCATATGASAKHIAPPSS